MLGQDNYIFILPNPKTIMKKFYVTTPIYYANGRPHVGSVYTTLAADIFARWNKLQGKEVFFLTGTDEHGKKIQEAAEQKGKSPQEFTDEIAEQFKEMFKKLNFSNNNFIRTTGKSHIKQVTKVLQGLYDKGFIYKGEYESYYCVGCEQYLKKSDLVEGKCPLHNKKPELKKEEAYLFKLSAFQDKLLKAIKSKELEILPKKRENEIVSFIESGLQDISISRKKEDVPWGVELPFDKDHTCYVWIDAFWNYISGLGKHTEFWPADLQLMANDIIRVHATIWPAVLLALGKKLPKKMLVHGYFTLDGKKISKSLGNYVDPQELLKKYPADSIRYFLIRNISFGDDGDFSEESLVERHNNELANKLGNLVSRVSSLAEKYGVEETKQTLSIKKLKDNVSKHFEDLRIDKALSEIFTFIDTCNEYVQKKKPWETKDKKVLYELAEALKEIGTLLSPFIPETAEKIIKTFKAKKIKKAPILFQKIEKENIIKEPKINEIMENVAQVEFADWEKLDLRTAEVENVEDIEGADKLYKISLDVGELGKRTICAGLKQFYKKEELKGKKIIYLSNLKPRKMKGIESQGMLLAASDSGKKKVSLLTLDKDIENGAIVG
jgi:methionyl-tRNA synthetase